MKQTRPGQLLKSTYANCLTRPAPRPPLPNAIRQDHGAHPRPSARPEPRPPLPNAKPTRTTLPNIATRLLSWWILGSCLCLHTSNLWAYNRTRTALGVPTAWIQMPITYYIGKGGSKDIADGSDIEAIKQAFATWANVDCAALSFRFAGLIDQPQGRYDPKGENQNHIFWVEPPQEWSFAANIVAVATVFHQPATGEIKDADLRFNGHQFRWSTQATPPAGFEDIQNTATHEIGHMLGLGHADAFDKDATMSDATTPGEIDKRSLAQDDRDGLCAIYPKTPPINITFRIQQKDLGLTLCPSALPLLPSTSASGATKATQNAKAASPPQQSPHAGLGCSAQSAGASLYASFLFSVLLVLLCLAKLGHNQTKRE